MMLINLHGLVIECKTDSSELTSQLVRPFHYFLSKEKTPDVTVIVKEEDPPYKSFPSVPVTFSTPRNVVYKTDKIKIIDYFGKGVILEDRHRMTYTLYSRNRNFLVEAFYLLTISLFGQFCDMQGMLRVHALAISYNNRAILLPIPPGGGKSTMAMALLEEKQFKLISDDEPIFNRSGYILPFPLRIGTLNPDVLSTIPENYVYEIDRMEFGRKYFIDCKYWDSQIENQPLDEIILFTSQRVMNGTPSIEPVTKLLILRTLIRDAVIGIGLYQGIEFLFSHSSKEVIYKIHVVLKRLKLAMRLASVSTTYRMIISDDIQANARFFTNFIKNL
jgi:hypothetical protein